MTNTVHEDDLVAWYRIVEPRGPISMPDFKQKEDDLLPGGPPLPPTDRGQSVRFWNREERTAPTLRLARARS
jgi:hypothetical protein